MVIFKAFGGLAFWLLGFLADNSMSSSNLQAGSLLAY